MTEPERCDLEGCDCLGTNPDHFQVLDGRCAFVAGNWTCRMGRSHYWHDATSEWSDHAYVPPKEAAP
jgi:hypothetical protein